MTILIADDSVSIRQMLNLILSAEKHTVVQAVDGADALKKFGDEIDVVITDYNMPGMSGPELIRAIRSGPTNKSVPCIMLTTESEAGKKMEGMQAGATAWITKPFNRDALLMTLGKVKQTVDF